MQWRLVSNSRHTWPLHCLAHVAILVSAFVVIQAVVLLQTFTADVEPLFASSSIHSALTLAEVEIEADRIVVGGPGVHADELLGHHSF